MIYVTANSIINVLYDSKRGKRKMNRTNYERIINDYYYKENKSLAFVHNYISQLKTDRRINMNRWFELHCHILNLEDY